MLSHSSVFRRPSRRSFLWASAGLIPLAAVDASGGTGGARRSFLAFGAETYIQDEDGARVWEWPENTRDGWALANGNVLLVETRKKDVHGGNVLEVSRSGEVLRRYAGTQDEVNTAQPLPDGGLVLTEAGAKPRIVELDAQWKVRFSLPLECQTADTHLQSRMTRKLANGNYLVPLMGEKEVREYTPKGKIVWRAGAPHWPFTAIRLANGNSLVTCTRANEVIEFDGAGKPAWRLTNADLDGEPLNGCCGAQRLPNGNTVVTSYQAKAGEVKLTEVTPAKELVWSYRDQLSHGIHHFQILSTNGEPVTGIALK